MESRELITEKRKAFHQAATELYKPFPKEMFKEYGVKRGLRNED